MHWTLFDMSPLFATMLLDRQYGGLQSSTDYKFASRCLRMLREEFNCRAQLTVRCDSLGLPGVLSLHRTSLS